MGEAIRRLREAAEKALHPEPPPTPVARHEDCGCMDCLDDLMPPFTPDFTMLALHPATVTALLDVAEAAEALDVAWKAMRHVDPTEEGVGARVTALRAALAALRRLDAAGGG